MYAEKIGHKTDKSDASNENESDNASKGNNNNTNESTVTNKNKNSEAQYGDNISHSENKDEDDKQQDELNEILLNIPKTPAAKELHEIQIEEELLDARLRLLEKRQRLQQMESSMMAPMYAPIAQHFMRPSYQDMKHLVPLFTGSDDYDAYKWLGDFERACETVNADELSRLKFFRQSMKSDSEAELFLRTDTSATYSGIRKNFLANFGHIYSVSEVIDRLRKTTFRSVKTTVMGYILKMQEIA